MSGVKKTNIKINWTSEALEALKTAREAKRLIHWNDEMDKILVQLYNEGIPKTHIAKILCAQFGKKMSSVPVKDRLEKLRII